jgi:8-oxo-dGTP pyrophosphatase MutT (NUDIX family)
MSDAADARAKEARKTRSPTLRPRDAATLILIDRAGPWPLVLMGRRHAGHKFMPGKFVFPGGRIEPGDRRMSVAGPLDALVEDKLMARTRRPSPGFARALALAAIRETFEATGLALGVTDHAAGPPQAFRRALLRRRREMDRASRGKRRQRGYRARRADLDPAG